MDIFNFIGLLGGLALFIFGMTTMAQGLEKAAGDKLQKIIETLTGNVVKGVVVGAAVTGVIQSSTATTVMVIGFVNAGIMTLRQAVGVILGANIGTTFTALLISLNMIDGGNFFFMLVKPSNLAPLAVLVGVVMIMMCKKSQKKNIAEILIGFGVLFTGLEAMENAVYVLRDLPQFAEVFATLSNPILGVLAGFIVTAIIQSSTASIGILQAMAQTGLVPFSSAIPILMGQNIGTTITALFSSIGTNKNAKRAAFIHLYVNVLGTVFFMILIYVIHHFVVMPFWSSPVNSFNIAQIHILFNIFNTILLLPCVDLLVKLVQKTVKDEEGEGKETTRLDVRFLTTPAIALEQAKLAAIDMSNLAINNFRLGKKAVMDKNVSLAPQIVDNEKVIDKLEFTISQYLVQISEQDLSEPDNVRYTMLFHSISDLERIGDHAENFSEVAQEIEKLDINFSERAVGELSGMFAAVDEILELSFECFRENDYKLAIQVEALEEVIDLFKETLKSNHIERLGKGGCSVESGIYFLEIINNLERVADHCSNIAFYIVQKNSPAKLNPHEYQEELHGDNKEFKAFYKYYEDKFYKNVVS